MGKNKRSSRDEAPNPSSVPNRETFQRLNFLYQASAYLKGIEGPTSVSNDRGNVRKSTGENSPRKKGAGRRKASLGELGSAYVQCMRSIGNKSVIRMDPNVKRTLCKGCDTILLPGATVSVRVKSSSNKGLTVVYTCLTCRTTRSIPAPPVAPSPVPITLSTASTEVVSSIPHQSTLEDLEATTTGSSLQAQVPNTHPKKRRRPTPRPLPFFARPGHVVFRGNEIVHDVQ